MIKRHSRKIRSWMAFLGLPKAGFTLQRTIRSLFFAAALVQIMVIDSLAQAASDRHEVMALWAPLFGQLKAQDRSYSFYSALGGGVVYRYAVTPWFVIEAGYEAQSSPTSLLLHGPDIGVFYSYYGRPSFSLYEEPLSLAVEYPFEAHIGISTWLREHDFSSFLPKTAGLFTSTQDLANKGRVLGFQTIVGMGFDLGSSMRLVFRTRYLYGLTPAIDNSGLNAMSVQCGLSAKL